MTATAATAQTYGDEGPTLTPNTMGLIYEDAINENVPGQVNIRRVSYKIEGFADGLHAEFAEELLAVVFHRVGCAEEAGGDFLGLEK